MVKGNIGSFEVGQTSILTGTGHIVVSYPVKDGLKNITAGTAVKLTDEVAEHLASDTDDAIGIIYQPVTENDTQTTQEATALVVVSGAVKRSAITFTAAKSACTAQLVEKLRKNGIYAI